MKVIGLIGGMSWESSSEYYRLINQETRKQLGGLNSAKVLMYSVNHHEINELEHKDRWAELIEIMVESARRLEKGGADFILICCNAIHKIAEQIQNSIEIPLIHIADAAAEAVKRARLSSIGLLGAKAVMEEEFFKNNLVSADLKVLIPAENDREFINDVIFNQLAYGKIVEESRERTLEIIKRLKTAGSQGVILGCTELPLLIREEYSVLPLFDTLRLHAQRAVDLALAN
ncbi:MAG: aspartate/glutamate racemase family protein [Deltaproteobacteria bacterium]|nr:aspartate/glutamate racemase family protein [Deltaproteobacteria bacterium]